MEKKHKIYQKHICIDHDNMKNQLILLFTIDNEIVGLSIVAYPEWFKYVDDQFAYYPFCHN